MQPLAQFPAHARHRIRWVLTDIDDTVTEAGKLPGASLSGMERLVQAGIAVIPVTGRPAGWCDHMARMWPVAAVVGENGAFYFSYDARRRRVIRVFARSQEQRRNDRLRLNELKKQILRAVPEAGIASDQEYRIADLAIDFCEDVAPLSAAQIETIVAMFKAAGATAKVSSIHVNGWFGSYDKITMSTRCLREVGAIDPLADGHRVVFVGDSPNDEPMFNFFPHSIGVANIHDFSFQSPPAWVTVGRGARGFQEVVETLVSGRGDPRQ
jgi:HAD superfamily hydrolase (TIGR01484 family)